MDSQRSVASRSPCPHPDSCWDIASGTSSNTAGATEQEKAGEVALSSDGERTEDRKGGWIGGNDSA